MNALASGIGMATGTDIRIPGEYNGLPVTKIANEAFYNCENIKSVTIPESVTSIGACAFSGCDGLTDAPSEVTEGWYYSKAENTETGTSIDVTNPSENAVKLRDTYKEFFWKR